jgi:hypothetical protein
VATPLASQLLQISSTLAHLSGVFTQGAFGGHIVAVMCLMVVGDAKGEVASLVYCTQLSFSATRAKWGPCVLLL